MMSPLGSEDSVPDRYPGEALEILCAVLPNDRAAWPYDMEKVLQRIIRADGDLAGKVRDLRSD
uniref:Uncharacterized protein n=1 Tax=Candidatus Kentrum sp. TC TaxID=2126339 RepID=A0A451AAS5_9GAMM|nr:MAG: hypothetical protein BECKTC1821E_GA0114239_108211 [Candidatus Kentron sp. TC]VFK63129.1 MAG: hypothetical protein BECKTC1821F_GA0114240_108611 [Candidatus Kentron sp. TC]